MQLCLIRHAIAVERGTAGYVDDRVRPLTPEGRKRMREAALGLKGLVSLDAIATSPVLRARQTAEILEDLYKVRVQTWDSLGNGSHHEVLTSCAATSLDALALVGHEPWMSELLSVLLTGDATLMSSVFRKGAAALVSTYGPPAPGNGTLEWLIQPGALRKLAAKA
ncbi:MAG: histidine phosphatase family protein [Dehalococcoidia bacterium]|nr:histidine phosphatase family protein [Dehalococcoidia bacterium]